jgi:hypothetical protein
MKHDPLEDHPRLRRVVEKARREAELELNDGREKLGYCHRVWELQKQILCEKYGLDWKTPQEMNPGVLFD